MKKLLPALALLGTIAVAAAPSAQTFQNGPYYANPSWDQQIPAAQRFIVLSNWNNEAVLDRETGLVWERSPSPETHTWIHALAACRNTATGRRLGWRLPSEEELSSLFDPFIAGAALDLPTGHPFQGVVGGWFWTASTFEDAADTAWSIQPRDRGLVFAAKTLSINAWCVRGGSAVATPPY